MATADEIKIRIIAKDEASKVFRQTQGSSEKLKASITALKASFIGLSVAGGAFLKSVIDTGSQVQNLQVRMKFLTGSTQRGTQAFQAMLRYASKVPFALEDIQLGAPSLLTVAKGTEELNELLEITGDLAAASGLSFQETSMQMQRALAGGIASAELFRERGISAMLGFEAGVSYSAEKTKEKLISAFRDGTTSVKGASLELANTFTGQVSMMQDAWFNLKNELAKTGVLSEATKIVQEITEGIKDPAFQEGVKSFTTNMLDLFRFMVAHKDELMVIAGAMLGSKVGGAFGKTGKVVGGVVGGLASFLGLSGETLPFQRKSIEETGTEELRKMLTETIPNKQMEILLGKGGEEYKRGQLKLYDEQIEKIKKELDYRKKQIVLTVKGADAVKELTDAHGNELAVLTTMQEVQAGVQDGINAYTDSIKTLQKEAMAAAERGMKSLENAMVDMMMGAKSAKDAFKDMARSIVQDIVRIYVRRQLLGGITGMGGGDLVGSLMGSMFGQQFNTTTVATPDGATIYNPNLSTFAGGGFTGSGGRSGGVDGKGGFPAILHPNETVLDHTAGQGMGGDIVNVNFNINAIDTQTGTQFLAANKPMIIGMIAQAMNRKGNRSTV